MIIGVDRLDMIKGIPQKYLGFEKFLEENPNWRDQVVLVQIAVPTRNDVPECKLVYILLCFLIYIRLIISCMRLCFIYRSKTQKPSSWTRWTHKRSIWFCLFSSNSSSGLFAFSIYTSSCYQNSYTFFHSILIKFSLIFSVRIVLLTSTTYVHCTRSQVINFHHYINL